MKDLYQLPEGYILNPFTSLYQNSDVPISDPCLIEISELPGTHLRALVLASNFTGNSIQQNGEKLGLVSPDAT